VLLPSTAQAENAVEVRLQEKVMERSEMNIPTIGELCADLLKLVVPHVFDAEDETVLVLIGGFADVGVEFRGEYFALLLDLGEVHHTRTL